MYLEVPIGLWDLKNAATSASLFSKSMAELLSFVVLGTWVATQLGVRQKPRTDQSRITCWATEIPQDRILYWILYHLGFLVRSLLQVFSSFDFGNLEIGVRGR